MPPPPPRKERKLINKWETYSAKCFKEWRSRSARNLRRNSMRRGATPRRMTVMIRRTVFSSLTKTSIKLGPMTMLFTKWRKSMAKFLQRNSDRGWKEAAAAVAAMVRK